MKHQLSIFLSTAIFITTFSQDQNILKTKTDSLYQKNPDLIGILIHVESPKDNLSWSYSAGKNGKNTTEIVKKNQPLLIASNTKTYVSATILRLVEQNKLQLDQTIDELLTNKSRNKLAEANYQLNKITIKNLLSHTGGIRDYVDDGYIKFITENRTYNWTRDEQIARAVSLGKPLGKPNEVHKYGDINYVLLTEIIEQKTGLPFYQAIKELLDYKGNNLNSTWFINLEKKPKNTLPMVNQHWSSFTWDIKHHNPSWDLYGGGGIAATMEDVALFYQNLFNGKIVKNKSILDKMYSGIPVELSNNYYLGISKIKANGVTGYNHGGGLGTDVTYFPELDTTIAIATVEADKRETGVALRDIIVKYLSQKKAK